jgi:hypothetical protein
VLSRATSVVSVLLRVRFAPADDMADDFEWRMQLDSLLFSSFFILRSRTIRTFFELEFSRSSRFAFALPLLCFCKAWISRQ